MKPFNLEKFLAGEPAITRDGRKVVDFHYFKDRVAENNLVCLLSDGYIIFYLKDGKILKNESSFDLLMEEKEVYLWVNVYDAGNNQYNAYVHKTEDEAKINLSPIYPCKGTYKITIKE
jgi:hypothetical protein